MARQNVSDLRLAIIELDGCVFPLNHYRYNFYKNLCKKQNVSLDRQTFYEALGNMYDMYDRLPLAHSMDSTQLNDKVEKDLYNYLKMRDQKANDGALELLEYLRQKDIKIAIVTTHKTKNAISYLEMGQLYNKVDYVIGNDTKLQPFPSTEIFEFLMDKFKVTPQQTLLVTSLMSLLETGKEAGINMIYLEDLVPAGEKEKALSYQVAKSLYETLNDIIFGRYEDYKMYESILGLDEDMTPEELKDVRIHLEDLYKDDDSLMDIVNKTYEYRLSELNVNAAMQKREEEKKKEASQPKSEPQRIYGPTDDFDDEPEKEEEKPAEETPQTTEPEAVQEPEAEAEPAAEPAAKEEDVVEKPEPPKQTAEETHRSIEDILGDLEDSLDETEEHIEDVASEEMPDLETKEEALKEDIEEIEENDEPAAEEAEAEQMPEEEPEEVYEEVVPEENQDSDDQDADVNKKDDFGDTIIYNGPIDKESYEDTGILSLDPQKTIELDDVLSKVMARNEENFGDEDHKDTNDFLIQDEDYYDEPESKLRKFANVIINILYTFALSLVILIIGLVIYIGLQTQFEHGVLQFIASMYKAYSGFATVLMKGIFNGLHAILPFFPSYATLESLSEGAATLINVYFLDTIVIAIVELLVYFLKPKEDEDDYYENL